LVKNLL